MPLFEYHCADCNESREVLARSRDAVRSPRCPVCGAPMEREWVPVAKTSKSSGGAGCSAPGGRFT